MKKIGDVFRNNFNCFGVDELGIKVRLLFILSAVANGFSLFPLIMMKKLNELVGLYRIGRWHFASDKGRHHEKRDSKKVNSDFIDVMTHPKK